VNERLRTAMVERGKGTSDLAAACNVDPKTADRWVSPGRVPHRRHRWVVAHLLQVEETHLWPELPANGQEYKAASSELLKVYPDRASVPREVWIRRIREAQRQIDVLVFAGTFFAQTNPRVAKMLSERVEAGVKVRLCFGSPSGAAVETRDREEDLHGTLAAKIRASLTYYRDLLGVPGCEIRLHDATLYASIFRYDDHMILNPHIWGQPASANPVLQLRRHDDTGWFDRYADSFSSVWETAVPWIPSERSEASAWVEPSITTTAMHPSRTR
jgi:hypothetical protein